MIETARAEDLFHFFFELVITDNTRDWKIIEFRVQQKPRTTPELVMAFQGGQATMLTQLTATALDTAE